MFSMATFTIAKIAKQSRHAEAEWTETIRQIPHGLAHMWMYEILTS